MFLSIFLGMLSAFYTTMTILFVILFVLVISFSLILFAMQSKIDFTSKFAYLYIIFSAGSGRFFNRLFYKYQTQTKKNQTHR